MCFNSNTKSAKHLPPKEVFLKSNDLKHGTHGISQGQQRTIN